jgi:hypothetical protein
MSEAVSARVREEIVRRAAELDDPCLTALTIVVKVDRQRGQPGAILWRPEYERKLPG